MVMPSAFTKSEVRQIIAAYKKGAPCTQIAKRWGVDRLTIANYLRRNGVSIRPAGSYGERKWAARELAGIKRMWKAGEARWRIAKVYGAHTYVIRKALVAMGINGFEQRYRKREQHYMWKGGRSKNIHGYMVVWLPQDHRFASMFNRPGGGVLEHRIVMAEHLGRVLEKWETVHHINGDRTDNRLENLQLRVGRHGYGIVLRCRECKSHDLEPVPIAERRPGDKPLKPSKKGH